MPSDPLPVLYTEDGQPANLFSILGSRRSAKKAAASRRNGALGGPKTWKKNKAKVKRTRAKKIKHGKLTTEDFA